MQDSNQVQLLELIIFAIRRAHYTFCRQISIFNITIFFVADKSSSVHPGVIYPAVTRTAGFKI